MEVRSSSVWAIDLDDARLPADTSTTVLDAAERERAAAFVDEVASRRYAIAHSALRSLLGAATGMAPGDVRLLRAPCARCGGAHGKPFTPGGPDFSLSRSDRFAVVAIAWDATVGVDIEVRQAVSRVEPLRAEVLAPGESSSDLLRTWVRKEALLKASGEGLTRAMSSLRADDPAVRDLDLGALASGVDSGDELVAAVVGVGVGAPVALFTGPMRRSATVRQPMPLCDLPESDLRESDLPESDLPESGE